MYSSTKRFAGNLTDIDLRLLRVFRCVVESHGFTAAEVALGMDKSSISKHIANLETRLNMRLCRRGRSGFALTEAGEQIYNAASELFTALEDFRARVNAASSRLVGTLCVGFVDSIVTDRGSPLLRAFSAYRRNAPDVHIRLSVGATAEIEKGVMDGTLRVGVMAGYKLLLGFDYRTLYEERSLLYCSREHPLFRRPDPEITPEVLAAHPFVARSSPGNGQSNALLGKLVAAATADHDEAVAMLVLTGQLIGFLPQHYADLWVSKGEMRALAPDSVRYFTPLVAVTRTGAPQSAIVDRLLEELEAAERQHVQEEPVTPHG